MTPASASALITRFYTAFAQHDAAGMAACYHPQSHFTDEIFDLHGDDAPRMWHMLCSRGRDMAVEFNGIASDGTTARAHWEARYTFSATGRPVHNIVDAHFKFRNGLIVRHVDHFDFWRWARQALGAPGWLLGWSGVLKRKVQANAAAGLAEFKAKAVD